jgi:hypothetical protein
MEMQAATHPDVSLPLILPTLIMSIKRTGGLQTQGIFRVSPSSSEIMRIRNDLEIGNFQNIDGSAFTVGALLKQWFAELDEPLIPVGCYEEIIRNGDDEEVLDRVIHTKLPELNRRVLLELLKLLREVASEENQEINKMGPNNLAVVWAPNIFRTSTNDPTKILGLNQIESNVVVMMIERMRLE